MDNLIPGTQGHYPLRSLDILESRKQNVMLYEQSRILVNRPDIYLLTWRLAYVISLNCTCL